MLTIVVATRDERLRRRTEAALAGGKYAISAVSPGKTFVSRVREDKPDAVLVFEPATASLRHVRASSPRTAVIVAVHDSPRAGSSRAATMADDFVVQPFEPAELKVRLERAVRRLAEQRPGPGVEGPARAREVLLTELHDPRTGRLDAKRLAAYLGLSLTALARATGKGYKAVFKSPANTALQPLLAPMHSLLLALHRVRGGRREVLAWLNTPHAELAGKRPIDLILAGRAQIVADLLEATLAGVPT
jgi:CheY-like chemotaxis protein